MTGYSQLTQFSLLFHSKVAIHLSNKSTLQLISQKVFQKVIMWLGYKELLVLLGIQNAQVVSQIMNTTQSVLENLIQL